MPEKNMIKEQNLKIEFAGDDNIVKYSNFAIVSHSQEEFVFDFAHILPGKEEAKIVTRIVMTPKNAKNFLGAIGNNISNYERQHGEIIIPAKPAEKFHDVQ
ncbi:MAG: DUF3467 domain-containing protein [Brevinematales bacterium]|jgi:hypothetical protein